MQKKSIQRQIDPQITLIDREYEHLKKKQELFRSCLPHLYGHKWYFWQRNFFNSRNRMCLLNSGNQIGKLQPLDTQIPTPKGFVELGDIKVGDYVFGSDGKPTLVKGLSQRQTAECFEITFCDNTSTIAAGEHLWKCKTPKQRFRKSYKSKSKTWDNHDYDQWVVKTTNEIIGQGRYSPESSSPCRRCSIPSCLPVEYEEKNLFDPYLVGLAIGDGCLGGQVVIAKPDSYIHEYILSKYDATVLDDRKHVRIRGLNQTFRELNLLGKRSYEKHIPKEYLEGSIKERKALLAGLMDTDGTIYGKRTVAYATTSKQLRDDFIHLVCSLGGRCKHKERVGWYNNKEGERVDTRTCYEIMVWIDFNPFHLPRKSDRYYRITSRRNERVIYKIESVGKIECVCISVDNEDGTYLCTENYIVTHNSTVQIWKTAEWATNIGIWPELWNVTPNQFWYLYPTKDIVKREWRTKWKEWMPRGDLKNSNQWGWKLDATKDEKDIRAIEWNSGIRMEFMTYAQNVHHLQAGTVHYMPTDEETPEELWPELSQRIAGCDGYFSSVFTATRGGHMWLRAMEGKDANEQFPDADKQQISKYDCLTFDDGSQGLYTVEKIKKEEASYSSQYDIDVRIRGKFGSKEGRRYWAFDPTRHYIKPQMIPSEWDIYSGTDIGSGLKSHPAACMFIAVRPDYQLAWVFKGKRFDDMQTTAGDVLREYRKLRGNMNVTLQTYDWQAKDFAIIAERDGEAFMKAEKSQDFGQEIINTLFDNDMMFIFDDDPELAKLGGELLMLMKNTDKSKAKDDACDALRFASTLVPWNWVEIKGNPREKKKKVKTVFTAAELLEIELDERRNRFNNQESREGWGELEDDIAYWNSQY